MMGSIKQWMLGFCSLILVSIGYAECLGGNGLSCTLEVKADITNGCYVDMPDHWGTLDFGTHAIFGSKTIHAVFMQNAAVNMRCTPGMPTITMSLDGGENYQGSRRLRLDDQYIDYKLYTDHTKSQELLINEEVPVIVGPSSKVQLQLYAEATLSEDARAGTYQDKIILTISY